MPKSPKSSRHKTTESNTYRFFVEPSAFSGADVRLDEPEIVHQIGSVLRLRVGDQVVLLDNAGWQYTVTLSDVERKRIAGVIEQRSPAPSEPHTSITVYLALIRAERFEWALQKGTEIGVASFVPLITTRTAIADAQDLSERKADRWRRIVREAAEQARRGRVPHVAPPTTFDALCAAQDAPQRLVLWEGEGAIPLRSALRQWTAINASQSRSISVISGPEGGFTIAEIEQSRASELLPVTLGPRTLRAETAPLVAATAIFYETGDLD